MSGRKKNGGGTQLGRALIKSKQTNARGGKKAKSDAYYNGQYAEGDAPAVETKTLDSVIDKTDMQSILDYAEMAQNKFLVEKQNVVVLNKTSFVVSDKPTFEQIEAQQKHWNDVIIPRRPAWTAETTPEELGRKERESFLEWRRKLAGIEDNEHLLLTPYERNIEIWRQLWRVIERSDLIVQILDARDPLLFRSLDLEKYIQEFSTRKSNPQKKICLLMLNKADLLSNEQRTMWAEFFTAQGIRFVFFSAYQEQVKIDQELKDQKLTELLNPPKPSRTQDSDDDDSDNDGESSEEESQPVTAPPPVEPAAASPFPATKTAVTAKTGAASSPVDPAKVLDRDELFNYFQTICAEAGLPKDSEHLTVGMVGYPNVGKSSTINVLYHRRKVAVSATPGKTKHFQTLKVNDNLTLCDCPGLVFPTFMSSRAEMTVAGLLRIDEMKDHLSPVSIVVRRIPRQELDYHYGITLPANKPVLHPSDLLQAFARARGFYNTQQRPDESKAAKLVLKDYVNGKLLFCRSPPSVPQDDFDKLTVHHFHFESDEDSTEAINDPDSTAEEYIPYEPPLDHVHTTDAGVAPSGRVKHARANRTHMRRAKHLDLAEPDRDKEQEVAVRGVYVSARPTSHTQRLPTEVRLLKQPKRPVAAASTAAAATATANPQ